MPSGILGGAASGASAGMALGPFGSLIGGVLGGVLGGLSYNPPVAPKLSKVKLDDPTKGQTDFLEQGEHLGDVGDLIQHGNDISNQRYQSDLEKFAPNLASTTGRIGATGAALAGGQLPQGFLSGGPNGRALSAADLGLTSDDLVKSGAGLVGAGETAAGKLNPFNTTSTGTLITPGALLARDDSANYYNTNLKNQAAIGVSAASAINPFASGVATGLGSLGSSMRGFGQTGFGAGDTGPTSDAAIAQRQQDAQNFAPGTDEYIEATQFL